MATYKSHFTFIPIFEYEEVSNVDFGGFLIDKFINSQPGAEVGNGNPENANSPLPADKANLPSISASGVPVWDNVSFADAMIACANRGRGWHLMTPHEQAAMAYLAKEYNIQPDGNTAGETDPPSSYDDSAQVGIHDGEITGRSLVGTGNLKWAENKVFDLKGIAREWCLMLMASTNHSSPGQLFVPANLDLSYKKSPFGRGIFRTNSEENFERVYLTSSDLSALDVGHSVESGDAAAEGYIVNVDSSNSYVYVRVTSGSFENKDEFVDTTSGTTLTIDGAAGTGSTGIDSLVSIHCNENSSTVWTKDWEINDFFNRNLYIAESTNSGEMVTISANTGNELIFDPTSNMDSNFSTDDNATFCIFKTVDAGNITNNFSNSNWYSINSLYTNSDLGPFAVISESTTEGTIYDGQQYFNYNSTPVGDETSELVVCEVGGSYTDQDKAGVFMKVFESTPDNARNTTSFRACKTI